MLRPSPRFGYALRTLSALAVLGLSSLPLQAQTAPAPAAPQTSPAAPAAPKEIDLTEKQIQGVIDAQKDFDAITETMPTTETAQIDPKFVAQFEATAKKHGFASYADYNDAVLTMSIVLNGFDAGTKTYVGPEAVLKKQLAAVQADPKLPEKDKKAIVAELNAALKSPPPPVQNKANVALIAKYYDKLAAVMSDEE